MLNETEAGKVSDFLYLLYTKNMIAFPVPDPVF